MSIFSAASSCLPGVTGSRDDREWFHSARALGSTTVAPRGRLRRRAQAPSHARVAGQRVERMAVHGSAGALWAVELYAVGAAWLLFVLAFALRAGLRIAEATSR